MKASFVGFMIEITSFMVLLLLTIPMFTLLVTRYPAGEQMIACGGYSSQTIYAWSVAIQVCYFVIAAYCGYVDHQCDRLQILASKRIINPNFPAMKTIPWQHVMQACHLAIMNSLIAHFIFLCVLLPAMRARGSCAPLSDRSYVQYLKYPFVYPLVDFLFYSLHRVHHVVPYLYQNIHKLHHEWKHTFAVGAIACHPLEHVLVNLMSVFGAPLILGLSTEFTFFFVAHGTINTVFSHSGYEFVPMIATADPHDYHHHYFKVEFGAGGWTDKLFKTRLQDIYPAIYKKVSENALIRESTRTEQ